MAAAVLQHSSVSGTRAAACSARQQPVAVARVPSNIQQAFTARPFTSQRTAVPRLRNVPTHATRPVVALVVSDLTLVEDEVETLPKGYEWYEAMLILRPTLSDEARDQELAKFEAFLNKESCLQIDSLVRGRAQMAYAMKGNWEGHYVLYTFMAKRATAKAIQHVLSNPDVGSEDNIMRFMVFRKSGRR